MCKTVPEQVRHRLDPSCFLSSSNSFLLPLGINLEISGRFYSRRQGGSYEVCRPTGSVDLGLNKSWLDGCRRIALLMTDVFHTERWDSYGTKDKLYCRHGHVESRKILLRLTYGFGKQKFEKIDRNLEEDYKK